jgi:hypothetical protein
VNRLVSLDVLRGLAIFAVVWFHAMAFHSNVEIDDASDQSPALMNAILYFVTWAGAFGMISGVAHSISMYRRLLAGKVTPRRLMGTAVVTCVAILLINYAYLWVFCPGWIRPDDVSIGILPAWIITGDLVVAPAYRLFFATALTMVAWGIVLTALSVVLLTRNGGHHKRGRNYLVLGVVATAFVWTYPWMQDLVRPWLEQPVTFLGLPGALVASWLAGPMDPIFPYAGFTLYGVIFGMMLVDRVPRSTLLLYGYGLGGVYSVVGYVLVRIYGFWNVDFDTPDLVPLISIVGPIVLTITATMHLMDLRSDKAKAGWVKRTRLLRTFGILSLTAFVLEGPLSAVIRRLVELFEPDFTRDAEFIFLIFAPLILVLWVVILKLWSRARFAGSLEWLMIRGIGALTGKQSDRLNVDELLRSDRAYLGRSESAEA